MITDTLLPPRSCAAADWHSSASTPRASHGFIWILPERILVGTCFKAHVCFSGDYRRGRCRMSGGADGREELLDLELELAALACQKMRRGKHPARGGAGLGGRAIDVADI